MKKLITFVICFFLGISFVSATYIPTKEEKKLFDTAKTKIIEIYEKDINKAYGVKNVIDKFYKKYENKPKSTYFLKFIDETTQEYIKKYEDNEKQIEKEKQNQSKNDDDNKSKDNDKNTDNKKDDSQKLPNIDDTIAKYLNELATLNKDTKTIANLEIEPRYDHLILQNVYFQNIGTVIDMANVIKEVYLVNKDNKILSTGYVRGKYLYFDLNSNVIIKSDKNTYLYVKAVLGQPNNQKETGELKFQLSTPSDAPTGTLNGIRAIGYSNGKYINVTNTNSGNPIVTFVTYNESTIVKNSSFQPSFNEVLAFKLNNNSIENMDIKSFDIKIGGTFLTTVDDKTKFILREKNSNQVFGSALLGTKVGDIITIKYGGGSAYSYLSGNTSVDYVLEIEHSGNPTGNREVRLDNVVIGDGFGGVINNLNQYTNTGVPTDYFFYRY